MVKLDEQLKLAIAKMPQKEKDKLLLRLVAKDHKLVERLIFQLIEGGETTDSRAREVRETIERGLPYSNQKYLTPGVLMMAMRDLSGQITAHVAATKDKSGDVILNCFLLAEALRRNDELLRRMPKRTDTFAPYLVKKTAGLLKKAEKLHEDFHIEFRRDLNEVLNFIFDFSPTRALAGEYFLPRRFEI